MKAVWTSVSISFGDSRQALFLKRNQSSILGH